MKQVLLRVPESLHQRLTARARREGRSVNALATELLEIGAGGDTGTDQERIRAKAKARGVLVDGTSGPLTARTRAQLIQSLRGVGPVVDDAIGEDRERV